MQHITIPDKLKNAYLTELRVGDYLRLLFPNVEWIHDKKIPNIQAQFRPDYRSEELKLVVEFDGYHHYTRASIILADQNKNRVLTALGYKVIRIPYFMQMSPATVKYWFNIDVTFDQQYKHGFIDWRAELPASFCELGIAKFTNQLLALHNSQDTNISQITNEILDSLLIKSVKFDKYSKDKSLYLNKNLAIWPIKYLDWLKAVYEQSNYCYNMLPHNPNTILL